MNTEDIIDEIQYLKKRTVLLEKLLNTKQNEQSVMINNKQDVVLNDKKDKPLKLHKKRSIC